MDELVPVFQSFPLVWRQRFETPWELPAAHWLGSWHPAVVCPGPTPAGWGQDDDVEITGLDFCQELILRGAVEKVVLGAPNEYAYLVH